MIDSLLVSSPYAGLVIFITLSGCGMPIPEEAYIVLAGILSAEGRLDPTAAVCACTAGVFAGDLAMYCAGYFGGDWASKKSARFRQKLRLGKSRTKVLQLAQRYRPAAMFLSHFTWGLRPLTHVVIGATRMPLVNFLIAELIVATVFASACFSAAYYVGEPTLVLMRSVGVSLSLAVILVVLAFTIWLIRPWFRSRLPESSNPSVDIMPQHRTDVRPSNNDHH